MEHTAGFVLAGLLSFVLPLFLRFLYNTVTYVGIMRPPAVLKIGELEITIGSSVTFRLKTEQNGGVKNKDGGESNQYVTGTMFEELPSYANYTVDKQEPNELVVSFDKYARLTVRLSSGKGDRDGNGTKEIYEIEWESLGAKILGDLFNLQGSHWYGGGHVFDMPWPLENWNTKLGPYITGEPGPFNFPGIWEQYYGGVQERYWLSSAGVALFADFDVPLFVSTNYKSDGKLRLVAKHESPYQNTAKNPLKFGYKLLRSTDALKAHQGVIQEFFTKPTGIPSQEMFKHPIWSTWAQYKTGITQEKVLEFAKNIKDNGFKSSQIEIDDDWTPHYGDFDFDKKKFPDAKKMVEELKSEGYRVTLWMHPFITPTAKTFWDKWSDGFWVRSIFCHLPAIVSWWNGYAAAVDVTDPKQCAWYKETLKKLQKNYGIDSFKFDAGDAIRLSTWTVCKTPLDNPNHYTKIFAQICAEADTELKAQELRVGTGVQNLPMFFRLQDKDSNWGTFNGIKTVIPHVLTQGLLGYPFVLPDMIGGNAYALIGTSYPDRELYIRWVELNALLPSMQFSVVPWMFDDEVVQISQKMCALHEEYSGSIISLAKEAVQTGFPICRPVWWLDPADEVALTISTEFLLGDDVLVAPVLDKGVTSRDVYLPKGQWKDANSGSVITGKTWIRNHPAPLHVLPYFIKVVV